MKRDLLKVCLEENTPLWDQCLDTPFLQGIAQGTLPEDCFKGYIVDDSLYLQEYSKVFAWGMLHAQDMAEIRAYYSLLSFVNEGEGATRRQYLKKYGLTDENIQHLPLRPENRAYVDRMIEGARDGEGAAECLMASLPCMLSYGYIFRKMVERNPGVLGHRLWPLCAGLRRGKNTRKAAASGWSLQRRSAKSCRRSGGKSAASCSGIARCTSRSSGK